MLLFEQMVPQPPQLRAPPAMSVSQPFACLLPSQSAKPGSQAPLQLPAPHVGLAMFCDEQMVPQAPQLIGSVVRVTSQPSTCLLPLQSAVLDAQAPLHRPPPHEGLGTLLPE